MDRLATALLQLKGLCVTNAQADGIKKLYDDLLDYDKQPIIFKARPPKQQHGRFARSKKSGYTGITAMKR